jgi:arsenite methyltransferase
MTTTTDIAPNSVDPAELDRRITEMYRDVANGAGAQLHFPTGRAVAEALGYPAEILDRVPAPAVSSFAGVGYHFDLAELRPGERVLDLGSGSGMDVFAAATQVGRYGHVAGVDMTPEQLDKARRLRERRPVSFHRARIEALPFDDEKFDAVISNGVINLSPDKSAAFAEAARVLRPGGRLALADIVTDRQIAQHTVCQADLWAACIAGASQRELYLAELASAGLDLRVARRNRSYRFSSERAESASSKYGAHTIELLAVKPEPNAGA